MPSSRRREILDAALDCFARLGFAAATMEDIRKASGASTGSIYHHFAGKEQLAAALYVEALRDWQTGFVGELARRRDAAAAVRAVVAFHLRWVERRPTWARWLLDMGRQAELVQATQAEVRALNAGFTERVMAWMAPHVEDGILRPLPPDVVFALLIGPAQVIARMWLGGHAATPLRRVAAALGDAAWRALATEPSRPAARARGGRAQPRRIRP